MDLLSGAVWGAKVPRLTAGAAIRHLAMQATDQILVGRIRDTPIDIVHIQSSV